MRGETAVWLAPMLDGARKRGIDTELLEWQATMPAIEFGDPVLDRLAANAPGVAFRVVDWVRFGELLRHELGWEDTYPGCPVRGCKCGDAR